MKASIQRHAGRIIGALRGWDRLRFRGTLRVLADVAGLDRFMRYTGRRLVKDFKQHALELSRQVRQRSQEAFGGVRRRSRRRGGRRPTWTPGGSARDRWHGRSPAATA